MVPQLLIPLLAVLGSVASPAPEAAMRPAKELARKQLAGSQRATDVASAEVERLQGERKTWIEAKRSVAARYKKQLATVDALKRRRSGWRRNRELRKAYAESYATAKRLASYDRKVRGYASRLKRARVKLLRSINKELAGNPPARRARILRRLQKAERLRGKVRRRRIVLPNDRIDPLASAEELEEQAALLKKSEEQLAREIANLEARESRFRRMAKLKKARARAGEMAALDVNNPRRTTGRTEKSSTNRSGGGSGDIQADPAPGGSDESPSPGPSSPPPTNDDSFQNESGGGTGADYSVILADVVDTPTLRAYRNADRSGNPARKADAAKRLRAKAKQRLRRLRSQRKRMLQAAKRRRR